MLIITSPFLDLGCRVPAEVCAERGAQDKLNADALRGPYVKNSGYGISDSISGLISCVS